MRAVIGLLLIMTSLLTTPTWAQNRIPIEILVEDLSPEPCGLTTDAIKGRARLALRQYGFIETEDSIPYFYITVNSLEIEGQCVGHIRVEIRGWTEQDLGNDGMGWVTKAEGRGTILARAGSIFTYPRYKFPSMALDNVETQVKSALARIEY